MFQSSPSTQKWPATGRALNVEVIGIDPKNQGAVLMLKTIRQELEDRFPNVRIGVDVATPFEHRMALGVWGVTPADWQIGWGLKRTKGLLAKSFKNQRHRIGLLESAEIDLVLDASGFAYGDYWGQKKFLHFIARRMPFWKKNGTVLIALPQAWGPFSKTGFKHDIKRNLEHFDRVYARDSESSAHLQNTGLSSVRQAPDFTNLLRSRFEDCPPKYRNMGILIPNSKIVARADDAQRKAYLKFMQSALVSLSLVSDRVGVLIHEGDADLALAKDLTGPFEILTPDTAMISKLILSKARAVVSGRYHGLVSALSAGVPSMACAWTHKYDYLMQDYGLGWARATLDDRRKDLDGLARLVALTHNESALSDLQERAAMQRKLAQSVWDDVARLVHARVSVSR